MSLDLFVHHQATHLQPVKLLRVWCQTTFFQGYLVVEFGLTTAQRLKMGQNQSDAREKVVGHCKAFEGLEVVRIILFHRPCMACKNRKQAIYHFILIGKTNQSFAVPKSLPTIRQLRYFATLAQTGQYRRAAEQLGLSQPSLSQQIVALEDVLSIRLVERGRRGAQLTSGGREVLEWAQKVLDDVEGLMEVANVIGRGGAGTLHLGATVTIGPYFLPRFLHHLHNVHPDLKLVARDGVPRDLLDELLSGTHDLLLTQLPVAVSDFHVQPLYREPMLLAVARDHPLADRNQVAREDLRGQDVLTLGAKLTLHAPLTQLCADVGARLRDDYIGTSLDALRQMVAMNMGVTFLPALYAQSEVPKTEGDVVLIPVRGGFYRQVGLVWRKSSGKPRLIEQFAGVAQDVVKESFARQVQPTG